MAGLSCHVDFMDSCSCLGAQRGSHRYKKRNKIKTTPLTATTPNNNNTTHRDTQINTHSHNTHTMLQVLASIESIFLSSRDRYPDYTAF